MGKKAGPSSPRIGFVPWVVPCGRPLPSLIKKRTQHRLYALCHALSEGSKWSGGCDHLVWSLVLHAIILSYLDVLLCTLLFFFVWCALSVCLCAHAVVCMRGVWVSVSALSYALCACSAVVCVPCCACPCTLPYIPPATVPL